MPSDLPSPWREFLAELDGLLDEAFELHCIGGFALLAGYSLPRSTIDLDYRALVPYNRLSDLQKLAGPGSALARKHRVHLQHPGVESMPENYAERITEAFPGHFRKLRLWIPDPYDLVLSKLSRNAARDREDVEFLARTQRLDPAILRARCEKELKASLIGPTERHDKTLEFWLEAFFARP